MHKDQLVITVDGSALRDVKAGTAVYLLEILRALNDDKSVQHRFTIFLTDRARAPFDELLLDDRFEIRRAPVRTAMRMLWQQFILPIRILFIRADVHWGAGFVLPLLWPGRMAVTVHDLTFQLMPAVHERIKRIYFPLMIRAGLSRAKRVIAISDSTHKDIAARYPHAAGKVEVTKLAPRRFQAAHCRSEQGRRAYRYILSVGTQEPRKNLGRLIRAWIALPEGKRREARLLIAGAKGWMLGDLPAEDLLRSHGIEFLGFVPDEELAVLMKDALALAYPSLYEGFGLPVIEAMEMGTPVLTSNVGATKEVAGDAALLIDPCDEVSIQKGLEELLTDGVLRERLSKRGRARAEQFSWEKTTRETLAVLERAAGIGERV